MSISTVANKVRNYIHMCIGVQGLLQLKDATMAFKNHEKSGCHREAVEMILSLPATTMHITPH